MNPEVPIGYRGLSSVSSRIMGSVNLIGVVTDARMPFRTKGRDWVQTFSISDFTYEEGLLVRFFRPMETEFPKIQGIGDVVILRNMRIMEHSGRTVAVSTYTTSWVVFASDSIPEKAPPRFQLAFVKDPRAPAPSSTEMDYAMSLCNSRDRSTFRKFSELYSAGRDVLPPQADSSAPQLIRDKFSNIKDVQIDNFYDLVGQVVKIYPSNGKVELYITDYTANSRLYNYVWNCPAAQDVGSREGDEFGYAPGNSAKQEWQGPFGRLTLAVTLWPKHSEFAESNVKKNQFVSLRNVRIKEHKNQNIEGVMHSDQTFRDKVNVSIIEDHDDDRVKNILRRKMGYNEKFKTQSQSFMKEARERGRNVGDGGKHMSRGQTRAQVRKKRKQQKGQALRPQSRQQGIEQSGESNFENVVIPPNLRREDLNKNIRSSHSPVPTRPLSSILSFENHGFTTPNGVSIILPFQNIKSRATVRIVDFFPPDIADFAVPCPPVSEYDVLSEYEGSDSPGHQSDCQVDKTQRWEWRFALVLEDAKEIKNGKKTQMKVYVADQDAVFLLKLDAEDLRASPQALSLLREKLFLLWGDLEELKSQTKSNPTNPTDQDQDQESAPAPAAQPKSKPFECCLKEYGIRKARDMAEAERGSVNEEGNDNGTKFTIPQDFGWERRWRLWGVTIV